MLPVCFPCERHAVTNSLDMRLGNSITPVRWAFTFQSVENVSGVAFRQNPGASDIDKHADPVVGTSALRRWCRQCERLLSILHRSSRSRHARARMSLSRKIFQIGFVFRRGTNHLPDM